MLDEFSSEISTYIQNLKNNKYLKFRRNKDGSVSYSVGGAFKKIDGPNSYPTPILNSRIYEKYLPASLLPFLGGIALHEALNKEFETILNNFELEVPLEFSEAHHFLQKNDITIFIDATNAHKKIIWNNTTNCISKFSWAYIKEILDPKSLNLLKLSEDYLKPAWIIYNPFEPPITDCLIDGNPGKQINTYSPPKWRLIETQANYPTLIKDFLETLFPIVKERSIILTWLKHAILYRVSHILLLVGRKGVGKNIFVEHLVKSLIGEEHFAKTQKGFFTGRFQDILEKNRIIFIDEIEAKDAEAKKDLKRLPNATQGIEKKGRDTEQYKIYYSIIIANNDLSDIWIECDDRRFFIPEMSNERLVDKFDAKKIQELIKCLEDEAIVSSFGHYILSLPDDEEFNLENAYITKTFYLAVEASLKQTELFIKNYLVNDAKDKYVPLKLIQDEYGMFSDSKRSFITPKSMNNFLNNYWHEGEYRLGELVKYEGIHTVKLSDRLLELKNITTPSNTLDELK